MKPNSWSWSCYRYFNFGPLICSISYTRSTLETCAHLYVALRFDTFCERVVFPKLCRLEREGLFRCGVFNARNTDNPKTSLGKDVTSRMIKQVFTTLYSTAAMTLIPRRAQSWVRHRPLSQNTEWTLPPRSHPIRGVLYTFRYINLTRNSIELHNILIININYFRNNKK